jgi:hypothetical protein
LSMGGKRPASERPALCAVVTTERNILCGTKGQELQALPTGGQSLKLYR